MYLQGLDANYRQNLHLSHNQQFQPNYHTGIIQTQMQTPPKYSQNNAPKQQYIYHPFNIKSNYTSQSPIKTRNDMKILRDHSTNKKVHTQSNMIQHPYTMNSDQKPRRFSPSDSPDQTYKPSSIMNNANKLYSIAQQLQFQRLAGVKILERTQPLQGDSRLKIPERSKSPYQPPEKVSFQNSHHRTLSHGVWEQIQNCSQRVRKPKVQYHSEIFQHPSKYLKIGRIIGKGKFSNVHMTIDTRNGAFYAMKVMEKAKIRKYRIEEQVSNEIKIQSLINHPNIVKLYLYYSDDQYLFMLLELAIDGDLYKQLKSSPQQRFTEPEAVNVVYQVSQAVQEIHSKGVIHRDIKPENVIRQYDVYKLSDLGCAVYSPNDQRQTFCGTLDYVAPELASGIQYSFHVDLWAIGILAFELVTGEPPFFDPNFTTRDRTLQSILEGRYAFPETTSLELRDFVCKLLQRDPHSRMTIQQIILHPWITKNLKRDNHKVQL